uniref:E3 ubiquitin-protein ligase UPL1 n=1 Tax=Erigeron canadensis TaxID=72917 RepID=UPI001CB8FE58|nr:E3 ubiquitin-protein ligase UPL1 [Erigeron canadensis]
MKYNTREPVPLEIRTFIDGVIATPLENIEEPLKCFVWNFEKGDFHHWVELFNCFDKYFEKHIKSRKDLLLQDDFLEHDPPFPQEAVLHILRVIRIILDNCANKHFYGVFEHHLSSLLASTDADVVEACLQTCVAFLKNSIEKHAIRDASLRSKLFAFAQGWGGKEEGLGLVACALENVFNPITQSQELGSTLYFEFYVDNESSKGLRIIHLPQLNTYQISDRELMQQLVNEYKVPAKFRFALLTRLRFARAFGSFAAREKYMCIWLLAFRVFVQACGDDDGLVAFFNTEPGFINELVKLLTFEDTVHEEVRILCLSSLAALCQDQLRQPTVLSTVTAGVHQGILSSLTQKAIDAVASKLSSLSVAYTEALISLITILASSTSGCSAMRESVFIPILLPLLKDTDPQHLHLVTSAVHCLEAFMNYSKPAATLFRDLGGLNNTIYRLKEEVSHVENGTYVNTDNMQPLYSDARRSLMKALLRAISLGTATPGTTSHLYLSDESLLPYCLCAIFKKATAFGGSVFSLVSTVMSNRIHKEPTCFPTLEAAGIPSAFLAAIDDGVPCSSDAITCIPQCLDALCLNNSGLQAVENHNSLRCLVKIFTTGNYVDVLTGDALNAMSTALDELVRHAPSLRGHAVDALIEILNTIEKLGSGPKIESASMETDAEDKNLVSTSLLNVEQYLPFFVNHAACLLESMLKRSETCRLFIEKKGVDDVLKLLTLPLMPLSVSIGQSIAVAFKNFSVNYSRSLARSLCNFMKEHLKSTNKLLVSLGGMQLSKVEDDKRLKVMRCLSSLEGILLLSISITKRNTFLVSELGNSDGEFFSDLGVTFKELLWQQSMCCDLKIDEKQNADVERAEYGDVDDITTPGQRIPVPVRNLESEFLVQRGEVFSQPTQQALVGRRVGSTRGHLEPSRIDSNFLIHYTESTSSKILKKKTLEIIAMDILNKLASTLHSFFSTLVKEFTSSSNRQTAETTSKDIGTALAKLFIQALSFSGNTTNADLDILTLKCRYLGKVVDHIGRVTFNNSQSTCYTVMVNSFYAQGAFKELLNTFEATSQLLWTLSHSGSMSGFKSCLLNTLDSYCNVLEFYVNSSFLLPPAFTSHSHLVIQPVSVGLSIGLFPVPKDPKEFVRMLQSQVLDVILPVWNHALFPGCNPGFINKVVTLLNHMYSGVSDVKCGSGSATNQRLGAAPPRNEATIATIMEMGFTRRRAEQALASAEGNSVDMAMEWLFSHAEDHLQEEEDDEMAEALALSLGSSSETAKSNNTETSGDSQAGLVEAKAPAIDDILATTMKLIQSSDCTAFLFTDLFLTLCNRDKGEDRQKVISYLIRQMKLYPLETSKEVTVLCTISHTLALLLTEDVSTREIAAENGIVSVAIDILMDFNSRNSSRQELPVPKCISALLLILVSLSQLSPKMISDRIKGIAPSEDAEKNLTKIYEKSIGYLTIEEGKLVNGGVPALFSIPRTCFFISYDSVTSAIIQHLIEDPQTLQTTMELEIRQTLSAIKNPGHILSSFLKSIAPLISRDPEIFMKAAFTVCQLETSGGKSYISLRKEREKEKDKLKVPSVEIGVSKCQKKIPDSVTEVIHHMIEILMKSPLLTSEKCTKSANAMEVDESATSKGKIKVDETRLEESENLLERSTETVKTTFVLKLLSDILLMSTPAVGIVLKRDLDMCQFCGSNGVVHHVVRQLLHPPVDNKIESDVPRTTLSKNASRFLVVLCGRSSEGRRRVISELVKVLCTFSDSANNSSKGRVFPDKKVFAFVDQVHSIFSKSSSSGNLVGSADITKAMIDGGMIPCLSTILQVLDLDHPEAPKVVNIILKVLEGLISAANASELSSLSNEKKSVTDNQKGETNQNGQHEVTGTNTSQQPPEQTSDGERDHISNLNHPTVREMRPDMEYIDSSVVLQTSEHSEMNFHVGDRGGNNTGDEDDNMGDDDMGNDDEDDDDVDGDDEDEDIAEDGRALMSPADTDGEDHDAYNVDMVDDFHENRSIEMRWREAIVLGQPRGDSGLMDMIGGPFQGVSLHDLSGVRRLALEHYIQPNRTSESGTEANGLRHPLLLRPSQSQSSDIRPSGGNSDVARYNMFDAQVIPFDHVRSSGVAPASLGVFPVGLQSTYAPERRGIGNSQWDDGQPQEADADVIARTVEDSFIAHLHSNTPDIPPPDDNQPDGNPQPNEGDHGEIDQNTTQLEPNQMAEDFMNLEQAHYGVAGEQTGEDLQAPEPILDTVDALSNSQDNMEIGEGSGSVNDQEVRQDRMSATDNETSNHDLVNEGDNVPNLGDYQAPVVENADVDMNVADTEANENGDPLPFMEVESSSEQNAQDGQDNTQTAQFEETGPTILAPNANGIDPTFLEALPEDLRAEVLASQQAQSTPVANGPSDVSEDIDPEFLAALPPDIQAEVLSQQRAQRIARQAEGQPVDMDNASIIATLPADLRHEVLLTSSESVISALPSQMIAEAQMLRDRFMSNYQARSSHILNNQRNGSGFDRQMAINRGIGVSIGHRASSTIAKSFTVREIDGEALLDTDALKALLRLLRLTQPLEKGLLQRLLLKISAHASTRGVLVYLLLDMIKSETEGPVGRLTRINSQRLYGCRYNVVYGRSQLVDGLPPLVLTRILEVLTYLATNHSRIADNLFYFDSSHILKNNKGKKEKVIEAEEMLPPELSMEYDVPILLFTKLLNHRSIAHLEKVLGLFQVIVHNAASKLDIQHAVTSSQNLPSDEATAHAQRDPSLAGQDPGSDSKNFSDGLSTSTDQKDVKMYDIFIKLPQTDLHHLCTLLGHEGLSDKVYTLTGEILKKLASIAPMHRKFFIVELSDLALSLSSSAIHELGTLRNTQILGHSTGSMAGASVLRTLQALNSLTELGNTETNDVNCDEDQVHATICKLNISLEPLWQELSECISVIESHLGQGSSSSSLVNGDVGDPPLPPETQRLMPFVEALLVLYEKIQVNSSHIQEDDVCATASEVKQLSKSSPPVQATDGAVTITRFAEKHRRLLNAFIRRDPTLLEKSLSMLLKAPRLLDFDNKRAYFRSRISEQHLGGSLHISVRRAYLLEDSYHRLRIRSLQDMKGRLNVRFQGEEGIDAGGLTREWYQVLSRVIFDKGALLFTTGGNNATFQPNPNSVYQTEHLSYFKFIGRVVAKALFDGQFLDVYFTRSFYKHILGVKVTYHDIEAVDPDYYKNLKWMLENDVSDIPDLTFSMDADEEKHILYGKTQVSDYELKPGGGNIRVTEETKHEYVDLVADHILTNAIRPQINSFLEGFSELIPRELISIFNDKELELLISGLPEIDLGDLKANTDYSGYTASSRLITWFWEVVNAFNKEDRARMLQFVTGTSKVPLEGFKALQGISGPQRFQIHKAYGTPERLPSAHTCFNQLDLPEYTSKEQLQERLLLAIHEASEGFGFG